MFCPKCGSELRDDAVFCDKCGAKISKKNNSFVPLLIAIIVGIVGIVSLVLAIITLKNAKELKTGNGTLMVNEATDTSDKAIKDLEKKIADLEKEKAEFEEEKAKTDELQRQIEEEKEKLKAELEKKEKMEEKDSLKENVSKFFEGEAVLELPSLETFSKGRMVLGDYEEDKATGGYVQYFLAGSDVSVVNCIAEYRDALQSYGVTVTGTLSSNDGEYNYTCYTCSYSGDASIEKSSINYDGNGACDLCFVTASKEEEAYIAAYIPEGVTFIETTDKMKNSY